jgi:hypothetical protein
MGEGWVGVITLPLIPSHQGRGNELLDPPLADKSRSYEKKTLFKKMLYYD